MSDNSLLEKLETFYIRFREIGQLITDPEVIQDMNRFVKLNTKSIAIWNRSWRRETS